MGLFDFLKKKEKPSCSCSSQGCEAQEKITNEKGEELAECECGNMCPVSEIEAKKAAQENSCACSSTEETSCCSTEETSCCSTEEASCCSKEEEKSSCCGDISADSLANAKEELKNGSSVKVLGSGCKKCNELEKATKEALASLNMDTTIDHITDFAAISSYGIMTTPALVVDGKVVSYGKVLKTNEVVEILKKARA